MDATEPQIQFISAVQPVLLQAGQGRAKSSTLLCISTFLCRVIVTISRARGEKRPGIASVRQFAGELERLVQSPHGFNSSVE
jgi:hypothetical protein